MRRSTPFTTFPCFSTVVHEHFSLTVARQRGILTRFPPRQNDKDARTKEVVKEQTEYSSENLLAHASEVNRHEMAPVWRGRPRPRLLTLVLAIWKIGFPALETL